MRPYEVSAHTYKETPLSTEYTRLPKRFGDTDAGALLSLSERAEQKLYESDTTEYPSLQKVNLHTMVADAKLEAALIADDPEHDHDDARMALVTSAIDHYTHAATTLESRIEAGLDDPENISEVTRLHIRADLENAYNDIVCGELTDRTRQEVIARLDHQHLSVSKAIKDIRKGMKSGYYPKSFRIHLAILSGLEAEIGYVSNIWKESSLLDTSVVAFLSTVRSGSGNTGDVSEKSRDTHDVVVAYDNNNSWQFSGVEVKRFRSHRNTMRNLGRYSSQLAIVHNSGKTETFSSDTQFAS